MSLPSIRIDFSTGHIALQGDGEPAIPLPQILDALRIDIAPNGSRTTYIGDVFVQGVHASLRARRSPYVLVVSLGPPDNLTQPEKVRRAVEIGDAITSLLPPKLDHFKWGTLELPCEPDDIREGRTHACFTIKQGT